MCYWIQTPIEPFHIHLSTIIPFKPTLWRVKARGFYVLLTKAAYTSLSILPCELHKYIDWYLGINKHSLRCTLFLIHTQWILSQCCWFDIGFIIILIHFIRIIVHVRCLSCMCCLDCCNIKSQRCYKWMLL